MALKEKILEVMGGPHPAAVATIDGKKRPSGSWSLPGFPDMTLVGGTMKSTAKVGQPEEECRYGNRHLVGKRILGPVRGDPGNRKDPRRYPDQEEVLEPDVRAVFQIG